MASHTTTIHADYSSRPIKHERKRRSHLELAEILQVTREVIAEEKYLSIRHLFYRLATEYQLIEKTEREYNKLCYRLTKWRRSGDLDHSSFADHTRWYYGSTGYASLSDGLRQLAGGYQRDPWAPSDVHVELWTEKGAMINILTSAASKYRVKVFPSHGFNSITNLYTTARTFRQLQEDGKVIYIYYFGDHDPSGVLIDKKMAEVLKDFGATVNFERVAVAARQINEFNLPTRPTKKSDPRSKTFVGDSVEIDAMRTQDIIDLVDAHVSPHIDNDIWNAIEAAEENDRAALGALIKGVESWENSRRLEGVG